MRSNDPMWMAVHRHGDVGFIAGWPCDPVPAAVVLPLLIPPETYAVLTLQRPSKGSCAVTESLVVYPLDESINVMSWAG